MDEQAFLGEGRQRVIKVGGFGEGPQFVDQASGGGLGAKEVGQQAEPLRHRICETIALSCPFVFHFALKIERLAFYY